MTLVPLLECPPEPKQLGAAERLEDDDHRVEVAATRERVEDLLRKPPFSPRFPF
jgi:hypothetical protein